MSQHYKVYMSFWFHQDWNSDNSKQIFNMNRNYEVMESVK